MIILALSLANWALTCSALYVAKGTPCSSKCNSTGGTFWPDLVCSKDDFANTPRGQTLRSCLECTIDSTFVNNTYTDGNSDQFWALFHMKYVQQYCLIDNTTPHVAAVNACSSACVPLSTVLETLWISQHPYVGQYQYCSQNASTYITHASDCAKCLQSMEESVILGNFVGAMNDACVSKPFAAEGQLIKPSRGLFDLSTVASSTAPTSAQGRSSATSSTGTVTSPSTAGGSGTTTQATNAVGKSPSAGKDSAMGLGAGATAGIGAGISILVIAIVSGFGYFVWQRRRKSESDRPQLAAELSVTSQQGADGFYQPKTQPRAFEKGAANTEEQIHEAPSVAMATSHIHELPAIVKG